MSPALVGQLAEQLLQFPVAPALTGPPAHSAGSLAAVAGHSAVDSAVAPHQVVVLVPLVPPGSVRFEP